jgi:hypothetical protein
VEVLATFDDWSRGHYGDNPNAGPGTFGGENMIPVANGRALKIREGTSLLSNTGIGNSADCLIFPATNGVVLTTGTSCWYVPSNGGAPSATAGSFAADALSLGADWTYFISGILVVIGSDKAYYVGTTFVTAIAAAPGGKNIATLGDRVYIAGFSGNENRIRYSSVADHTTWPAANFVDVGVSTNVSIQGMKRQRDSLILNLGNLGLMAEWYRVQGTPGINQTVTPITPRGPVIDWPTSRFIEGSRSRIWFVPQRSANTEEPEMIGWIDTDQPEVRPALQAPNSSGATAMSVEDFSTTQHATTLMPRPMACYVIADPTGAAVPPQRVLLWRDGIWTQHFFTFTGMSSTSGPIRIVGGEGQFFLAHGGSAATKPQIYRWMFADALDAAPREVDVTASTVTGQVLTPIVEDAANRLLWVQAVQVDYRHYSATTAMTCTVETHGIEENGGTVLAPQTSTSQSYTVSGAPATVGQRGRKTFYIGDAVPGAAVLVKLTACRGIAIERIKLLGTALAPAT